MWWQYMQQSYPQAYIQQHKSYPHVIVARWHECAIFKEYQINNDMEKKLTVRITESDHQRLSQFADKKAISIAGAIRLLIDKIK